MTLDDWFTKYFAPEYLNVQNPVLWKAQAMADLQTVTSAAKSAPQPAPGS